MDRNISRRSSVNLKRKQSAQQLDFINMSDLSSKTMAPRPYHITDISAPMKGGIGENNQNVVGKKKFAINQSRF
jgi:hypothetical protein